MSETTEGISKAWAGTSKAIKAEALLFIRSYAREHLYFNGGDVLAAWRETDSAVAKLDWRNKWGAAMVTARTDRVIKKVGRCIPESSQSHTTSLVLWQSKLYRGKEEVKPCFNRTVANLMSNFLFENVNLEQALWQAYEFGFDDSVNQHDKG